MNPLGNTVSSTFMSIPVVIQVLSNFCIYAEEHTLSSVVDFSVLSIGSSSMKIIFTSVLIVLEFKSYSIQVRRSVFPATDLGFFSGNSVFSQEKWGGMWVGAEGGRVCVYDHQHPTKHKIFIAKIFLKNNFYIFALWKGKLFISIYCIY